MVKVLMLGNDSSVKGGITTVINQFLEYDWKKDNIELKFIPTYIEKNNFAKVIFFVISYIKIFFYLVFWKPTLVHMHMSYKGSFTRAYLIHRLCICFKVKDIVHLHGSEFKKWYDEECNDLKKEKIKSFLRECTVMVVLGNVWKKTIEDIEPKTNIIVVNNTVPSQNECAKYNKEFRVIFLGVLIKRKGVDDLLEAIELLRKNNNLENIKVLIVGTGIEEEYLKNKTQKLKIDKYIQFLGWVNSEQKNDLLKNSQLMILPSYNEGLPMAILEGMSYGLPIIATNVGDISEAVINGKNGYLFNPGDKIELSNLIKKIIFESNSEKWNEMSNISKKIIENKFSNKIFFQIFENLYKKY